MGSSQFSLKRFSLLLVLGLAGLYFGLMAELYFNQAAHVYHPEKEWSETPADLGLSFEDLTLTASDGVKLSAWYVPAETSKGTVLICHGNARNMSFDMDVIEMFHVLGQNVLIVDYRGFGKSEGHPTEEGTYLDAQAAWDWLIQKGERPERIVLVGRSLGAAIAADLAVKNEPKALLIEAAFTSLPEIGQERYPFFPVKKLSRFKYDTLEKLKRIRCPLLIIHSQDDEIVSVAHAVRIHEGITAEKTLLIIGGPHKGGYEPTREMYYRGVEDFLKST
jgi:uncharacterized protein